MVDEIDTLNGGFYGISIAQVPALNLNPPGSERRASCRVTHQRPDGMAGDG
jgi:hypothetical protein